MNVVVELDEQVYKKVVVKTTPMMLLKAILTEACEKLELDPNAYGLKYKKQVLDLSLSLRFSNLSPGSKVALYKKSIISNVSESVTIAVQTEDHGRLTGTFHTKTTLWNVLKQMETVNTVNLTQRTAEKSGIGKFFGKVYVVPVCILMNKEYSTVEQLQATTLSDAGVDQGSHVIRLLFRVTDAPMDSSLVSSASVVLPVKQVPPQPTQPIQSNVQSNTQSNVQSSQSNAQSNAQSAQSTQSVESDCDMDRQIVYYKPPIGQVSRQIELPESFFVLTPNELKYLISSQQAMLKRLENAPLKTKAMRDQEQVKKREKYPKTLIRVRFPDHTTVQLTFLSSETIQVLYSTLRKILESDHPFTLYVSPPVRHLEPEHTFWEEELYPASMVYFNWKDVNIKTYLPLPLESMTDFPTSLIESTNEVEMEKEEEEVVQEPSRPKTAEKPDAKASKFPKWFKPGK